LNRHEGPDGYLAIRFENVALKDTVIGLRIGRAILASIVEIWVEQVSGGADADT
jgi:hypothetical protein